MSTLTTSLPSSPPVSPPRSTVIVQQGDSVGEIAIPGWVIDLPSYRRWAHSDEYPERGWVSFLDGEIWVDLSMEEFLTHNAVKGAYAFAVMDMLRGNPLGRFVHDRMLWTNLAANVSTEPDGLFYLWETMRRGRLKLVPGKRGGFMELEGTADMVLEIISQTSKRKDDTVLRELYWRAGVTEYWLVDALRDPARFDILVHSPTGYVPTPINDGWVMSNVLGREFRLVKGVDPLGHPQFAVEVR
jgi:Uma2 family endonuclease